VRSIFDEIRKSSRRAVDEDTTQEESITESRGAANARNFLELLANSCASSAAEHDSTTRGSPPPSPPGSPPWVYAQNTTLGTSKHEEDLAAFTNLSINCDQDEREEREKGGKSIENTPVFTRSFNKRGKSPLKDSGVGINTLQESPHSEHSVQFESSPAFPLTVRSAQNCSNESSTDASFEESTSVSSHQLRSRSISGLVVAPPGFSFFLSQNEPLPVLHASLSSALVPTGTSLAGSRENFRPAQSLGVRPTPSLDTDIASLPPRHNSISLDAASLDHEQVWETELPFVPATPYLGPREAFRASLPGDDTFHLDTATVRTASLSPSQSSLFDLDTSSFAHDLNVFIVELPEVLPPVPELKFATLVCPSSPGPLALDLDDCSFELDKFSLEHQEAYARPSAAALHQLSRLKLLAPEYRDCAPSKKSPHLPLPTRRASISSPQHLRTPSLVDHRRNGNMNNFSNFDPNGNPPRQAPNAQGQQQMNGINGPTHWPNVGAQADMNVLWEYIQNLSQMHEGIRAQTQHVLNGVQQIQARAAQDDGSPTGTAQVNGVNNGMIQPSNGPAQDGSDRNRANNSRVTDLTHTNTAEIARLQNELSTANNTVDELSTHVSKLQSLNQDYESSLTLLMEKLRPFAQQHNQALLAQKAHYLRLIEDERQQNLELRLEQSRWQESLGRLNENLRCALIAQTAGESPFLKKISALKAENASLRRMCGAPKLEDSDEEEEDEDERLDEGEVQVQSVNASRSTQGSPEERADERREAVAKSRSKMESDGRV
jgi:hypothetical protein